MISTATSTLFLGMFIFLLRRWKLPAGAERYNQYDTHYYLGNWLSCFSYQWRKDDQHTTKDVRDAGRGNSLEIGEDWVFGETFHIIALESHIHSYFNPPYPENNVASFIIFSFLFTSFWILALFSHKYTP